ncbi:uncharacterized protein gp1ba [Halichoeres trimaculatus]|uniref:uncharacterized protein gp1ba n=1 Tax=Halichoeres trimaculatus TaxID=147232 RepID=UPI003D9EEBB0
MHLPFLLLLFLMGQVATVTAVSGCLDTRDTDGRPTKNCKAADLNDIPTGLDPQTKVLLFPDNLFTALSWSSFQTFTNIHKIDLTGNKIPELTPSTPPLLPTLSILHLGSNRLTSLPDHSFSACPSLTELYLDNNKIHSLSDQTFSGLSKLEILDLSSNHIKVLPQLMLHPLSAIETLYIEKNEIKLMPHTWFSPREEVPFLFITANPWDCTCPNLYLQEYIQEFDLNFYIRMEDTIKSASEKVECGSPTWHKGKPVKDLEQSDLCSPEVHPRGDFLKPQDPASTSLPPPFHTSTHAPTFASVLPEQVTETVTSLSEWSVSGVYTEWFKETFGREELVTWASSFMVTPMTEGGTRRETTSQTTPAETTMFLPSTSIPTTARVQETTQATIPEVTTLPTAMPSTAVPSTPMPSTPMPSTAVPSTAVPSTAVPSTAVPSTAVPSTAVPSTTVPLTTMPSTAPPATTTPVTGAPTRLKASTVRGAGVFCFWLFAGLLLLCVASAATMSLTLWRLLVWYARVYRPLSKAIGSKGGSEGLRLLPHGGREEKETPGGGGGVIALYRSVLYIHREEGEAPESGETAQEGEEGGTNQLPVSLNPTGEAGAEGGGGVYRKTLYRLISKEDEIEGWRDVVEECRVSAEEGGRRGGRQEGGMSRERRGGASRKRYSVILREEKEEAGQGKEELDWVVGGWEVKRGGEGGVEPRSSWGEWLEHYLPRMPWAVAAPAEGEVPQ